jgi:hypothetical protein
MKKLSKILFILSFISLFMAVGGIDNGDIPLTAGMIWGVCSVIGAGVFGYLGELISKECKKIE